MESGARTGTQVMMEMHVAAVAVVTEGVYGFHFIFQGTVDAEMTPGATRGQTRGSFATKKRL